MTIAKHSTITKNAHNSKLFCNNKNKNKNINLKVPVDWWTTVTAIKGLQIK
jgi:hypothetical protein